MKEAIITYNEKPEEDGTHMAISWTELVRCKNCKHMKEVKWNDEAMKICLKHTFTGERHDDWFCADGEMKE